ncbi:guanylate kinase [Anaerolineae bacterium]|nr:guanylate kinase [Anaerolineae bacterium]
MDTKNAAPSTSPLASVADASASFGTGRVFIFVGPAAVGKNTIIKRVMQDMPALKRLPTATTRPPRDGEQEGIDHFFVTLPQFQKLDAEGKLLESEEVHSGSWYGVVRQPTEAGFRAGDMLVADIDIKGAMTLKRAYPQQIVTIFVLPPSAEALARRIRKRGGASEEEMEKRLARAQYELDRADECDHQVVNDDVERCTAEVREIVQREIDQAKAQQK